MSNTTNMSSTYGNTRVGWVAPNCGRGTMQLLYSCLSTTFLCTFTVFHPEVYNRHHLCRRLWWMLIAIFTPEIVMLRALRQYIEARDLTELMLLHRNWSVEHSWLTYMGGIRLIWIDEARSPEPFKLASYLTIKLEKSESDSDQNVLPTERFATFETPTATGPQLLWLLQHKKLDLDTFPTVAEIRDKSKTSYLLKGLACFEGIWLVVTLVGRVAQSLPISTLEISTLSYVACSFITYGLWWYKPYDIQVPLRVPCKGLSENEALEYANIITTTDDASFPPYSPQFWNMHALLTRFPTFLDPVFKHGMLAIFMVFGGIHLAAWGDELPTATEDYIWKVCAILSTVTAPAFFYGIKSYRLNWPRKSFLGRLRSCAMWGIAGLYLIVRLLLTIEPFVALRSVPVEVYEQVEWSVFVPHIF